MRARRYFAYPSQPRSEGTTGTSHQFWSTSRCVYSCAARVPCVYACTCLLHILNMHGSPIYIQGTPRPWFPTKQRHCNEEQQSPVVGMPTKPWNVTALYMWATLCRE